MVQSLDTGPLTKSVVSSHHSELLSTVRHTGHFMPVLELAHAINKVQPQTVVVVQTGGKVVYKYLQHLTPKNVLTLTRFGKVMFNLLFNGLNKHAQVLTHIHMMT